MPKSQSAELLPLTEQEGPTEAILTIMPRAGGELTQFRPFLLVLAENEEKALAMKISADIPADERRTLAKEAKDLSLTIKNAR